MVRRASWNGHSTLLIRKFKGMEDAIYFIHVDGSMHRWTVEPEALLVDDWIIIGESNEN